ncbi:helix-turn-helix domain-containing protein [Propioniciclava soli]|uniref:Helix-turn-helix domain-containing protein n=1 Tax=Propioniciclava soli TaxID=2775081 RepID=A0ABZ3C3S9_9ACTN
MRTIDTSSIPTAQLHQLTRFAQDEAGPELRDVLLSLSPFINAGASLLVDDGTDMSPAQVAQHLGMSRTHLYKLLDRGEIVSHRVGRDRRIRLGDVLAFEQQRQQDRRELAERFARQRQTRQDAVDEVADLL